MNRQGAKKDFLFRALSEFLLEWMRQMCREHLPRNQRPSEAKDLNRSYSWTFSISQTIEKGKAAGVEGENKTSSHF